MTKRSAILECMTAKGHYHHGNLREALVDAARCVIGEEGIANLSLRKVAKHAGVSQAAPYHHFDGKDGLLVEVAFRGFNDLRARLDEARATPGDARDRLNALGRAYVTFGAENPELYKLMFGHDHCPAEDETRLKEAAQASLFVLIEVIAEGQAEGTFRGDEPLTPALAIWSGVHGAVSLVQAKFHDRTKMVGEVAVTSEALIGATLAFLLDGVSAG